MAARVRMMRCENFETFFLGRFWCEDFQFIFHKVEISRFKWRLGDPIQINHQTRKLPRRTQINVTLPMVEEHFMRTQTAETQSEQKSESI